TPKKRREPSFEKLRLPLSMTTNSLRKPAVAAEAISVADAPWRSQWYTFHLGCLAAASSRSLRNAISVWFSSQVSLTYLPLPASSDAGASAVPGLRAKTPFLAVSRAETA